MAATSGASHAGAALITIILGATIKSLLGSHTELINDISEGIGSTIASVTGASLPEELAGILVISTVLAFLWGVAYHHARHGDDSSPDRRNNYQSHGHSTTEGTTMAAATAGAEGSGGTYGTVAQVREADTQLRASLEREFDDAASRLADLHDRLHEAGDREEAERATAVRDRLTTLERELAGLSEDRDVRDASAEQVSVATRGGLQATHDALEAAASRLTDEVQTAQSAGTMSEQHRQDCTESLRDIERTLAERKELLQTMGDPR